MKSKRTRFIAGSMALIMLMTGCSNGTELPAEEKDDTGYSDAGLSDDGLPDAAGTPDASAVSPSATSVENVALTLNEIEYSYTGGWKDNQPNGYGELYHDEANHIKGEWEDGLLSGQAEYYATNAAGDVLVYNGNFSSNQPSGSGELYLFPNSVEDFIYVTGDFSDTDTLTYYHFDKDQRLCDIGYVDESGFVSYIDNDKAEGRSFIPSKYDYGVNNGMLHGANIVGQKGEYFGQTDANGEPSGYGYCRVTYNLQGGIKTEDYTIGILAKWDGENYSGPVLWMEEMAGQDVTTTKNFLGMTKESVESYDNQFKVNGFFDGENYYGEYEAYTIWKHDPPKDDDGLYITRKNIDTYDDNTKFVLDDDGIYRGSYLTQEYYFDNGNFGYNKRRKACKKSDDGVIFGDFAISSAAEEGDYCNYDKDGNVIDYGILYQGGYESYMPEKEEEEKASLLDKVIAIGVGMVTAYAVYKVTKWVEADTQIAIDQWLATKKQELDADQRRFEEDLAKYKTYKAQAKEYRQKAQYGSEASMEYYLKEAERCENEAQSHYRFSLAFD